MHIAKTAYTTECPAQPAHLSLFIDIVLYQLVYLYLTSIIIFEESGVREKSVTDEREREWWGLSAAAVSF